MLRQSKAAQARADYRHELKRINRNIARLAKVGKIIPASMLPHEVKRPTQASVERLRKIKGRSLTAAAVPFGVSGVVPAEKYKIPRQKQSTRKKPTKKSAPKPPRAPKLARVEEPKEVEEREEIPTRYDLIYERLAEPIRSINVTFFRDSLLQALREVPPLELSQRWDDTIASDRKEIEEFKSYVNFLKENFGWSDAKNVEYNNKWYSTVYQIITGREMPADVSAKLNDAFNVGGFGEE